MSEQSTNQGPEDAELAEARARGYVNRVPWMGGGAVAPRTPEAVMRAAAPRAAGVPRGPRLPAPLDRSVHLEDFTLDREIVVGGKVIRVLRRSVGYPSGRLPGDPAQWLLMDPSGGRALCYALSPAAAAQCLAAWL